MDFGIIGAYALYAYGYARATQDIDSVTRLAYRKRVVAYLESLGLNTLSNTDAFSNHAHSIGSVKVDIMYVENDAADTIFDSMKELLIFKGLKLPVISLKHLIAMKLFAV